MKTKIRYFLASLKKTVLRRDSRCPGCGQDDNPVQARKYAVTVLRRCRRCGLMYRSPTTSAAESEEFYQNDYESGFTTDLPGPEELERMLSARFAHTPKDFSRYLKILEGLGCRPGQRVLDFGCSWGYGAWQFADRGYEVVGLEVSRPRAEFARERLGVTVVSDLTQAQGQFDVFFSTHVLEHVPRPNEAIAAGLERLEHGGLLVAITPNGSDAYRRVNPGGWGRSWGLKHPNLLDEQFYRNVLPGHPLITSDLTDVDALAAWSRGEAVSPALDGWELMAVCRKQDGRSS